MSKVFISYRREDAAGYAQAIYSQLERQLRRDQIFMDVDTIEPGVDFVTRIQQAIAECDVVIALIGNRWKGEQNNALPRIHDPQDFIHLEISAALSRDIRIIPVLVDGARMPSPDELPPSLHQLVRRQALDLSNTRFRFDLERVSQAVRKAAVSPSITKPIGRHWQPRILYGLSILVIALGITAGIWFKGRFDQARIDQARIDDLLKKARTAESNGHVVLPPEDNAIDYFLEVLRLNPTNLEASAGLQRVTKEYVASARKPQSRKTKTGFSLQDIIFALREGVEPSRVLLLVRERGLNFDVTPEVQNRLKQAGADAEFIKALKSFSDEAYDANASSVP